MVPITPLRLVPIQRYRHIIDTLNKKHVAESKNFEKDKFEKNFNEAFWHWATIGRDLKQLDKLKEKVEEMQSNFSPRNK